MRVLLTVDPEIPVPPVTYGGIERIVDLLVRSLRRGGHSVGLVAHPESTCPGDERFSWRGRQSQSHGDTIRNALVLREAVTRFKPEVIHSFSRLLYMLPLMRARLPKIMSYQREPTSRTVRGAGVLAGKSLVFTGNSEYICRQGRRGGGDWHAIHNFVDTERLEFSPNVSRDAPLVFLSRVESIKGAHTAIEVAKRTGRRLLIAGNHASQGPEEEYWEHKIRPHIGRDGIEYIGPVDDVQKNTLLGQAIAMIVPIEWEEPFGIVFAEALACGTPVISCPRGALPEIIRHGVDGFLVNSVQEACDAVSEIGKIDRAACRSRAVERFSAAVITRKYEQLYAELVARSDDLF